MNKERSALIRFNRWRNGGAIAEIERLQAALKQCEDWFRQYGDGHSAKRDDDKALRNYTRAEFARAARMAEPIIRKGEPE